jgi:hypothetical protein
VARRRAEALESPEAALATIERWAGFSEPDPTYGIWAMVPSDESRPVGTVLLKALPDGDGQPDGRHRGRLAPEP